MFSSALGGYSRAAALNPGWEEPIEKEKQLLEYLRKVTELIENKVGEAAAHCHILFLMYNLGLLRVLLRSLLKGNLYIILPIN